MWFSHVLWGIWEALCRMATPYFSMRKVSFGIKRNTGTAGLWLVLMFSLTFLFGLVFKIQRHDKSGVFGQSAGFSSSDHLNGAFSVFSLNAWVLGAGGPRRLARRVWPGDSHLRDIFPVLCFVAKEDISATSAKCPDLQCSSFPRQTNLSPLRTFSYFEEQSVTLWVSPFPPSENGLLGGAGPGLIPNAGGSQREWIPSGEWPCRILGELLIGQGRSRMNDPAATWSVSHVSLHNSHWKDPALLLPSVTWILFPEISVVILSALQEAGLAAHLARVGAGGLGL